jgi:hypothetical protein
MDPVTLGLCSQIDLDFEVEKAAKNAPATAEPAAGGATLLPASRTIIPAAERNPPPTPKSDELNADAIFAKLKSLKGPDGEDGDKE